MAVRKAVRRTRPRAFCTASSFQMQCHDCHQRYSPMRYRVCARILEYRKTEFLQKLTDGTIQRQEPDGAEIVASMRRARMTSPDVAEWYETCYCDTPLAHERATVYDRFFTDMRVEEATSEPSIEGDSFWDYLERSIRKGAG